MLGIRAVLAITMWALLCLGTIHAQARLPRWHDSLETAVEKARESGKPLFIVFRCVR